MLADFPQALVALLLVDQPPRAAPPMMLLYADRRVMALLFGFFMTPLALDEVCRPVPLLQHPKLLNPPAVSHATRSSLDLCRSLDTLLMSMIL
jgi:hypothetical protein